jgi:hypothetical protein
LLSFEAEYHPKVDLMIMNGSIMAHAYYPGSGIGGDVHFRADLNWNFDVLFGQQPKYGETSFFAVALHELGHSLGLEHSEEKDAVMYDSYSSTTGVMSVDDISAIHQMCGVPEIKTLCQLHETPGRPQNLLGK